ASAIGEWRVAAYAPSDDLRIQRPAAFVAKRADVSANYFAVLGVGLQLGRTFTPEEERGSYPAVVISDDLWRRVFNRAASVVGRMVRMAYASCRLRDCGEFFTIVGVAAKGFSGTDLDRVDLWSTLNWGQSVRAVARVPAGATLFPYEDWITARVL